MATIPNFRNFQPILSEATPDPIQTITNTILFHAHSTSTSHLYIVATDFRSDAWDLTISASELDDLRDEIGIGGTWEEFMDYFVSSLSAGEVKIGISSGGVNAKLIAHKSKGLPRISLSLNRLTGSSATDAMANFSLALFKTFKNKHNDVVKEHERLLQLEGELSSEKEKNESLQKQLDGLSFVKRKAHKSKSSNKEKLVSSSSTIQNFLSVPETDPSSALVSLDTNTQEPSVTVAKPTKSNQRAAPVSRRAKVRGVSLQDTGSDDDH